MYVNNKELFSSLYLIYYYIIFVRKVNYVNSSHCSKLKPVCGFQNLNVIIIKHNNYVS